MGSLPNEIPVAKDFKKDRRMVGLGKKQKAFYNIMKKNGGKNSSKGITKKEFLSEHRMFDDADKPGRAFEALAASLEKRDLIFTKEMFDMEKKKIVKLWFVKKPICYF